MLQVDFTLSIKNNDDDGDCGQIRRSQYITMYVPGADTDKENEILTISDTAAAMIRYTMEQYKAAVYEKQRKAEKEQTE